MKSTSVIGTHRSSWSIREVAKRNSLSPQFIRLEIKRGRLKARRAGRRVLVPVASEVEWLESAPEITRPEPIVASGREPKGH